MELPAQSMSHHGVTVVTVDGELDVLGAESLRHRLTVLIDSGHTRLVADLSGVAFMDSTGLGVLVWIRRRVTEKDGELVLVVDQDRLMRILRLSALAQVFQIHQTLGGALDAA